MEWRQHLLAIDSEVSKVLSRVQDKRIQDDADIELPFVRHVWNCPCRASVGISIVVPFIPLKETQVDGFVRRAEFEPDVGSFM
jgi:hypothetical protein